MSKHRNMALAITTNIGMELSTSLIHNSMTHTTSCMCCTTSCIYRNTSTAVLQEASWSPAPSLRYRRELSNHARQLSGESRRVHTVCANFQNTQLKKKDLKGALKAQEIKCCNGSLSMKSIDARTTWRMVFSFSWFVALAVVGHAYGGDYYTYQDLNGKLVISNNAPPPGSKIIKKETLSEVTDQQIAESQVREDTAGFSNRLSSL